MPQRILEPGEIERLSSSTIPFLRLPDRGSLFVDRAARLRQLAPGHPLGDYLQFVAAIAGVQHWALSNMAAVRLPDAVQLDGERDELYEAQASKLLAGITLGLDLAYAPLIGAALQVYWVHLVTALGSDHFGRIETATVCPACGSRPVASIARIGGVEAGYRYLHCSVCATEWHMVRIKCTNCESTKGIDYHGIEGKSKAVLAEGCDECNAYLKILYMDRDPQVEPCADDLASTSLDLLMAETGRLRSSQNLMLIHGDSDES